MHQLVEEYTQRPDVDAVIVRLAVDHLWSHIFKGSAECISHFYTLGTPAKVTQLDIPALIKQNVLRLKVPVDDFLFMQVVHSQASLEEVHKGLLFR